MNERPDGQDRDAGAIAARLREELARRRLSRQGLADAARISLSTLEKALSGSRPFTLATVVRIEDVLGVSLRGAADAAPDEAGEAPAAAGCAPESMGSYSRPAVRWIEGRYVTLRPSFDAEGAIYAYRTDIFWDAAAGHLRFAEARRLDGAFAQAGHVAMPNLSGHTYLVTCEAGQHRLIILGRATRDYRLFGLLSTLQVGAGSQLVPVSCPIAFVPEDQMAEAPCGVIAPDEAAYAACRTVLDSALRQDFCRWHQ